MNFMRLLVACYLVCSPLLIFTVYKIGYTDGKWQYICQKNKSKS